MEFSLFFGDGPDWTVGGTGAARAAIVVHALVWTFSRLKLGAGDDAEVTARNALARDEPFGKSEGPKARGERGMPFRPVGRIKALFGFVIC